MPHKKTQPENSAENTLNLFMAIVVIMVFGVFVSPVYSDSAVANNNANQFVKDVRESETVNDNISAYSRKGADTCLKCHDEDYSYPIFPIFHSKHGNRNDPRTPMAQLQCESCHGPGRAHATEPKVGFKRAQIIAFGQESPIARERQNKQCLQCHDDYRRMTWKGSTHEQQSMLCSDCHIMHARKDPVLTISNQVGICYRCHKKQRAEFARVSVHPVRYGKMVCGECHNPHGTVSDSLLKTNSKNSVCYQCHAEKRGPFLWAHAPVQENCGICHEHHGSIHTPLLKKRSPLLCQQCHSMAGHPSFALDGSDLSSATNSAFVAAKSCLNCHFQVHGSNHPSGAKLMR